jgi:hypothetical protein
MWQSHLATRLNDFATWHSHSADSHPLVSVHPLMSRDRFVVVNKMGLSSDEEAVGPICLP